jgi:hypothetical protein
LKKRTKKLLPGAFTIRLSRLNKMPDAMSKSVLLPFFKKEASSFNGTP